jgi:hypothetical protein
MKNNIQRHFLILSFVLITLISACKKDDEAHPAEVTSVTKSASTWTYTSPYYHITLDAPAITSSNINTAAVMVYFSTGGNWVALPYTQYNNTSPNYYMGYNVGTGTVQITWVYNTSASAGVDPNEYYGTTVKYKVVVISSAARKANPDLDLNNYEAVKEMYNLKE